MELLLRIYGPLHESLHAAALLLVGRRAVRMSGRDIIIPDDLTTRQYVFVAGLPALVFFGTAAIAMLGLLNATRPGQLIVGFALVVFGLLGGAGCVGDLQLIARRLGRRS